MQTLRYKPAPVENGASEPEPVIGEDTASAGRTLCETGSGRPAQEDETSATPSTRPATDAVCIIGNTGKMGAMLSRRLSLAGFPVRGADLEPGENVLRPRHLAALRGARCAVLCVPAAALRQVAAAVAPVLDGEQLLVDITSVKIMPMQWMEEVYNGPVVGAHPLFGPQPLPEDMKVALTPGINATETDVTFAKELFASFGCASFVCTAQEHDRGVAFSQSLNFTVSAAFFAALSRLEDIRPFLTPSFKRHLEAARKHLTQDTEMFLGFTGLNPEYPYALAAYRAILDEAMKGRLPDITRQAAAWYDHDGPETQ